MLTDGAPDLGADARRHDLTTVPKFRGVGGPPGPVRGDAHLGRRLQVGYEPLLRHAAGKFGEKGVGSSPRREMQDPRVDQEAESTEWRSISAVKYESDCGDPDMPGEDRKERRQGGGLPADFDEHPVGEGMRDAEVDQGGLSDRPARTSVADRELKVGAHSAQIIALRRSVHLGAEPIEVRQSLDRASHVDPSSPPHPERHARILVDH